MRVISGSARGTKLYTIEETTTRPTLDRVKESLFNIINNKIDEETVALDLFAGSGAVRNRNVK
jgi:16S rRNA (guanine966-N2)-methyltransferase